MRDEVSEGPDAVPARPATAARGLRVRHGRTRQRRGRRAQRLLESFPVQPRISGHDAADWHMHVTAGAPRSARSTWPGASWGLSVWLCEYGSARFGVCADSRCGNVYLDTSSNNCRRFCSDRCATRCTSRRTGPASALRRCRSRRGCRPRRPGRQMRPGEGEGLVQVGLPVGAASRPPGGDLDRDGAGEATPGQRGEQRTARLISAPGHQVVVPPLAGAVTEVNVGQARSHRVGHGQGVDPGGRTVRDVQRVRRVAGLGRVPARGVRHEVPAGHADREHVLHREDQARELRLQAGQQLGEIRGRTRVAR